MLKRLRSTWLAGGGAVLLVLSMTSLVAAAAHPSDTTDPAVVSPTLLTFEDVNGDGIDDDCAASAVTADADAAAAAFLLVDTNADGTISTTEAAHSDWVGGANCNHGGFVSWVSQGSDEGTDETEETEETDPAVVSPTLVTFEDVNGDGIDDDCAASAVVADPTAAAAAFLLVDANADGKISTTEAAHSDWVGGKNCNHGGFVSWVAHNSDAGSEGAAAAKAAKDALKAKPDQAAKQDVKAKHAHAVKANKSHGKGHGAK